MTTTQFMTFYEKLDDKTYHAIKPYIATNYMDMACVNCSEAKWTATSTGKVFAICKSDNKISAELFDGKKDDFVKFCENGCNTNCNATPQEKLDFTKKVLLDITKEEREALEEWDNLGSGQRLVASASMKRFAKNRDDKLALEAFDALTVEEQALKLESDRKIQNLIADRQLLNDGKSGSYTNSIGRQQTTEAKSITQSL